MRCMNYLKYFVFFWKNIIFHINHFLVNICEKIVNGIIKMKSGKLLLSSTFICRHVCRTHFLKHNCSAVVLVIGRDLHLTWRANVNAGTDKKQMRSRVIFNVVMLCGFIANGYLSCVNLYIIHYICFILNIVAWFPSDIVWKEDHPHLSCSLLPVLFSLLHL